MRSEDASTDQANASESKPEQSRTRPATVTARKLLEANSSRMVHRLSCAPARTERLSPRTVKGILFRRPISIRADVLVQQAARLRIGRTAPKPRRTRPFAGADRPTHDSPRIPDEQAAFLESQASAASKVGHAATTLRSASGRYCCKSLLGVSKENS
jgi:hypothetical protein